MNDLTISTLRVMQAVIVSCIVGVVLLWASTVLASDDQSFYYDEESGKMQMNDTWSPINPNSHRTTEADRRNYNDWVNSQTLKQNEAMIESYGERSGELDRPSGSSTPPGRASDYWVTGPDGRSQWCQQSLHGR